MLRLYDMDERINTEPRGLAPDSVKVAINNTACNNSIGLEKVCCDKLQSKCERKMQLWINILNSENALYVVRVTDRQVNLIFQFHFCV